MTYRYLFFTLFCVFSHPIFAEDPPDLYIAPYLQHVTQNSITVKWETTDPVIGSVEFGQNEQFDNVITEKEAVKIHEVKLTGLKPNKRYNYRAKYGEQILESASFKTAPEEGTKSWKFVAYGDNRSNPDTHRGVVNQIIKAEPAIVLTTGDLVARGNNYQLWKREFFDPLQHLISHIPIYVSLGNHEDHAQHYFDYFSFPDPENEQFYSFNYANAHIVALDSDVYDLPNPQQFEKKQFDWFRQDMEKHKDAEWKIVFFHHPLFNAHPQRDLHALHWQPLFEEYGVDLVLMGHDHYYTRNYEIGNFTAKPKRGIRHIITGGGGAPLYPVVERIHAAHRRSVHHIVAMEVLGDRIIGRTIDIDGNVFDSFVIDKQAEASAEEFIAFEVYQIERQLKEKIKELAEAKVENDIAELKTTFELDNPFIVPIKMSVSWNMSNGWSVMPEVKEQVLHPGEKIIIQVNAKGPDKFGTVAPHGKLAFSNIDGEKAFRNDELLFFPVKLWHDMVYSTMMTSMISVANMPALLKSITTIPLPVVSMDGTVHDYKPISDSYPANGLNFETILLNGKMQTVEFNDEVSEKGYVRIRSHNRMEISFNTVAELGRIILDLRAEELNEKIAIGDFKLIPRSNINLKEDEFFVRITTKTERDLAAKGWLKITAYAKNGIAGEFELRLVEENADSSFLKAKFKLPLRLK